MSPRNPLCFAFHHPQQAAPSNSQHLRAYAGRWHHAPVCSWLSRNTVRSPRRSDPPSPIRHAASSGRPFDLATYLGREGDRVGLIGGAIGGGAFAAFVGLLANALCESSCPEVEGGGWLLLTGGGARRRGRRRAARHGRWLHDPGGQRTEAALGVGRSGRPPCSSPVPRLRE